MKTIRSAPFATAILLSFSFMLPGTAAAEIEIDHDELDDVKSGERAELEAEVKEKGGDAGIREARAYFKTRPANRFYFVPLISGNGEDYTGVFPAMAAGTEAFDYFILARSNSDEIVKTETWSVEVKDSKRALARMESKPPRNVKIDVDKIEESVDLVEDTRKATDADRTNTARRGGEPDPDRRVDVRTETPEAPTDLAGVDDYLNLQIVGPSEVIGAAAVESAAMAAGGGVSGAGAALGGLAAAGAVGAGVAAAGSGGSDGGGGGTGTGGGTTGPAVACNSQQVAGGDTPESRTVELGQSSGAFVFEFSTFSQEDRMTVIYEGGVLFDTGCVGTSGSSTLQYGGSSTQVTVNVQPNCAGGTGTAWNFTVNCPM
jgi:hypothetical protein